MASKFKKDQVLRLKTVVPQGPVQKVRMTEEGEVEYLIVFTAADGQQHERWFNEAALEAA